MLLERIYDDDLAQASYLIGCQASGEALVVDPRRDVAVYLEAAGRRGLRVTAVVDTHIHADYLSGARELAAASGARLLLSELGGTEWQYRFDHEGLGDGSEIRLGNLVVTALHTPGHTPEHLALLLRDGAAADEPGYLLTGDFVFVGDVGRPDLLDVAAGGSDTRFDAARRLYASLRDRFLALPDYVQVLPGHGAGSACGKSLGAVPSSTVGYERRFAWWSGFLRSGDEDGFVRELLGGQPDVPTYFGRMKRLNRSGPPLLGRRPPLEELDAAEVRDRLGRELIVIDTRPRREYLEDAVRGALHVPAGRSFATYAAYALDPEQDPRPVVLLAAGAGQAEELRDRLSRIGVDDVRGYIRGLDGFAREPVPSVAPAAVGDDRAALLLDVRSRSEHEAGHIPGARRIHIGRLGRELESLPRDRQVIALCQTGARAAVAASMLRAAGFGRVSVLQGSFEGWEEARKAARKGSDGPGGAGRDSWPGQAL